MAWVVIAAGLIYVIWFWPRQDAKPVDLPVEQVTLTESRTVPYDEPAAAPSPEPPPLKFGGYPCVGDCSTHETGYRWAEQNGVSDPDSCTGDSAEFIEGCRVYARRRAGILQDD